MHSLIDPGWVNLTSGLLFTVGDAWTMLTHHVLLALQRSSNIPVLSDTHTRIVVVDIAEVSPDSKARMQSHIYKRLQRGRRF